MRVGLIGTRGVPARYGGFETLLEEVGSRLVARGHRVTVYCRPTAGSNEKPETEYRGMDLVHLPIVRRRTAETVAHTALSVLHRTISEIDVAVLFNAANAPFLPVLKARGKPVATHVDGLEWQRAKWGRIGKRYYRLVEALAVRWSDALIADASGISDYYREEFGAETELIAYGAPIIVSQSDSRVSQIGLTARGYHLVVARFEPENHVLEIVKGYVASEARLPLVVVGSAPYSDDYTSTVKAAADDRVLFLGAVWDQDLLNDLYALSASYVHGHSVGGTNPSLLRAAGAAAYTIAFDVNFNREVLGDSGRYFATTQELSQELVQAEQDQSTARTTAAALQREIARYNWEDVTDCYEGLCDRLNQGQNQSRLGSGRRRVR